MRTAFGDCLHQTISARGLSVRGFARHVGVGASFVSKIMAGNCRLPAERIEPWAEALGLRGRDRDRFLELAWLEHTPTYIRNLVRHLRAH